MTNPRKYKLIILVIGARGGLWDKLREVWQKYSHIFPEVRTHFVYGENSREDFLLGDLMYDDCKEQYPPTIHKTLRAFRTINNYDYDFVLRTNLSSFWDIPRLLKNLEELPTEKCYAGDGPLHHVSPNTEYIACPYVSGTDTILSKDVVEKGINYLDSNEEFNNKLLSYNGWTLPDDKAMGMLFLNELHTPIVSLSHRKVHINEMHEANLSYKQMEEQIVDLIKTSKSLNKDNYRVKNSHSGEPETREDLDPFIMNLLYKHYYVN